MHLRCQSQWDWESNPLHGIKIAISWNSGLNELSLGLLNAKKVVVSSHPQCAQNRALNLFYCRTVKNTANSRFMVEGVGRGGAFHITISLNVKLHQQSLRIMQIEKKIYFVFTYLSRFFCVHCVRMSFIQYLKLLGRGLWIYKGEFPLPNQP